LHVFPLQAPASLQRKTNKKQKQKNATVSNINGGNQKDAELKDGK